MTENLISVIVPVYNGDKYIVAAIESIFRQEYPNIEIIVVDDGSTDNTRSVLAQFGAKIQVIHQENRGQSHARNVGLSKAKGLIIGLLDADDIWPDNRTDLMLPYLLDDQFDLVRGFTRYVKNFGTESQVLTENIFLEVLVGSCLYKRAIFDKIGLFDEEMRQGEDFDWNIRLREAGCKEKIIHETTLLYRRHANNITNIKGKKVEGQFLSFRKKLIRTKFSKKKL
jgi:glycosyltransferase involved in cell wall biosynthesis